MTITPISGVAPAPAAAPIPAEQRELIQAVRAVNASGTYGSESELIFTFDRRLSRPVIRLVDRRTRELIRQIPAEEVLRVSEALKEKRRDR